jgi:ribonuclease P protein component
MLGRMLRPADFEVVLASPALARSAHFAAHHLPQAPGLSSERARKPDEGKLSTADATVCAQPVDDGRPADPDRCWYGTVVPKRHARKATTRNLLRRQIRAAMQRHHRRLACGLWLVRLRAPFDRRQFRSAGSRALSSAARDELDGLFDRAAA